jgi:hypothetical protein
MVAMVMDFHIRGRIESSGPAQYAAIAVAIPLDGSEASRTKQAVRRTPSQALGRLRELVIQLGSEIRAEGGTILEVVTDD